MRRGLAVFLAETLLFISVLCACGGSAGTGAGNRRGSEASVSEKKQEETSETDHTRGNNVLAGQGQNSGQGGSSGQGAEDGENAETALPDDWEITVRTSPLKQMTYTEEAAVTPSVAPYSVNADLSNVDNLWQFYLDDGVKNLLVKNGFSVAGSAGNEFFEIYETNRYEQKASFVTVDSLMHTYHLYFSYLMKGLEKTYLTECVRQLSQHMLAAGTELYNELKGSEWESAAKRDLLLFTVGASLMDDTTQVHPDIQDLASAEKANILDASGQTLSNITGTMEDYTQYIPRGYYEGDEQLERYFRTMMLYGRMHFTNGDDDLDRSAVLITKMMKEDAEAYYMWQAVYDVTSFFVGASDDLGLDQYLPIYEKIYGEQTDTNRLVSDTDAFKQFQEASARFAPPAVNTITESKDGDHAALGFRFMGQRFTIDAAIMQRLVYDTGNPKSVIGRMFPDVLDVPAALGNDTAMSILASQGDTSYENYISNMNELRRYLSKDNQELWSASLYSGWLDTLRPLLEKKGSGYPMFMQSEEWAKKDLECFAGSFTELKHDTVLYTKQVIAEMGGDGYTIVPDDRGYVEPEPEVYGRFQALSEKTAQGLKGYGMLSAADEENLGRLAQIAYQLREISIKELRDETLTDDEYELIRGYGGSLGHFWTETVKDYSTSEWEPVATKEVPAALVVDVATAEGTVLEMGTDTPSLIQVIVKVDGKIKIAQGSVYSFYQFLWPASDRLTDSKWRQMRGVSVDESGYYNTDTSVRKPDWTLSYRYLYGWE